MSKYVRKFLLHLKWKLGKFHFFDHWSDEKYLKLSYRLRIGKALDLDHPKSFNEKIQWLKIHDRKEKYTNLVDKIKAKEIVGKIIGEEHIIKTLGVYEKYEDIDFTKLPNRFIIKCNHNSGGVIIVNDKSKMDHKKLKKHFDKLLTKNYYYDCREYPYKNIHPMILIEENIQNEDCLDQISDYKLMCFNGQVKCSFVCSNRDKPGGLCVNFYDKDWNPMPFKRHYPKNPVEFEKPKLYEEMVCLAEKLSADIPFVRVDFYVIRNQIYFGELTFYPGSGLEEFTPEEWDLKLGEMLDLSSVEK